MRITASHIVNWANTHAKEAQTDLPRWVRRLCFEPGATRQLSFPAGDSTYVPGWDGVLFSDLGNAWVPAGASCWEVGCDQDVPGKANRDYRKRTATTSKEDRSNCTYVFVTPRRWTKKSEWIEEQTRQGEWADVRVYDADDLEQWLEQSPAVALQFAEALGLSGGGVVSLSRYWDTWARQCSPAITPEALFQDRASMFDALGEKLQASITPTQPLVIRADSVEEAVAFTVAVVMASGDLQHHALVVTEPHGWRYVEANPQLRVAIAARTETASNLVLREDLRVIIPHATGDLAGRPNGNELILERPNIYEFEKALIATGMEESDAKRYALSTGRSWTVFRRQRATNPAIQCPVWLEAPQAASLPLLCLLGAWHSDKAADRQAVEELSGRSYEMVEQDLRQLVRLDDAPLLKIGAVWKAKSPLELLSQCADRITSNQLDRFFALAQKMLSAPDPQLELPDNERWMAQLHGKVHPYSDLLFESICDSLIKLAVRAPDQVDLQALDIEERVAGLVGELLDGADGGRWLSLSSYLPNLAEAAPDRFLRAIQNSLRMADAPITRLFTETSDSILGGRCWHAGLLWALETLGWAPRRLAPVALILAQLSHVPMKGNWGNKPSRSLLNFFRSWFPQTAASLPERIKVLSLLIERDPEAAFRLLVGIAGRGHQTADHIHRPKWREDDAGAGRGVTHAEMYEMLDFVHEKLLQLSDGNAPRIVSLLQKTGFRDREDLPRLLELIEPFIQATDRDVDREIIRSALRAIINWHRNYDEASATELNEWLQPVETCYERLAPLNLVMRDHWLFDSHWLELPTEDEKKDLHDKAKIVSELRASSLSAIYQAERITGIECLIEVCTEPSIVGATLAGVPWGEGYWMEWIQEKLESFDNGTHMSACIAGFLRTAASPAPDALLKKVVELGIQRGWPSGRLASFLTLAIPNRETWQLVESCDHEVNTEYWDRVQPYHQTNDEDLDFVLEQLLKAKRPMSALYCCQFKLQETAPGKIFLALQQLLNCREIDGPKIQFWHLEKMLERLESSGEFERLALAQLEFGLFPFLQHGRGDNASALYEAITSEPQLFKELICAIYKPEHGERQEVTDASRATAGRAWDVLHHCKRLPGTQSDGGIDADKFIHFIQETRELCSDADRPTMCDQTLGQILSHSPADEDGTWPFTPAREILESPELENMRTGFITGTINKRGVTSRSPWDGGDQERDLAAYYRNQAERVQHSHPNVAAMLDQLAQGYERHGKREDVEANLRKEGF